MTPFTLARAGHRCGKFSVSSLMRKCAFCGDFQMSPPSSRLALRWFLSLCVRSFVSLMVIGACIGLSGNGDGATARGGKNWAGYGGDENEQHYSALNQINDLNVSKLKLAWFYDIDVLPGTMSAPVEVD